MSPFPSFENYLLAYYAYLGGKFAIEYKGAKKELLSAKADDLAKYLAALPGGMSQLRSLGVTRNGAARFFRGGEADDFVTFVPLTGDRSRDKILARATFQAFNDNAALSVAEIFKNGTTGNWIDAAVNTAELFLGNRGTGFGGYVWHHHEIIGVMQLTLEAPHSSQGHVGSPVLWSIIHNKKYDE
jgi:hypothetical protein